MTKRVFKCWSVFKQPLVWGEGKLFLQLFGCDRTKRKNSRFPLPHHRRAYRKEGKMSREIYKNISVEVASQRIFIKEALCKICNKPFKMHKRWGWRATKAVVETIQHGWFRGDDEVNFYHLSCYNKGVHQMSREDLELEIKGIIANAWGERCKIKTTTKLY